MTTFNIQYYYSQMDIFSQCDSIRQLRSDSDELYGYLFGQRDMTDVMATIVADLANYNLSDRMIATLTKAATHHSRIPVLFVFLFGLWNKSVSVSSCPLRSEKFEATLDKQCIKMVVGEYVNINDFVTDTLTEYII